MKDELAVRKRLRDDLEYFATRCLKIRTKSGAVIPFELNAAQCHIHRWLEDQRQRTGKVRAIILKGRQQGTSTYVQARFYHRVSHSKGVRAFILTHEDEATKNIFEIAERYYQHCPEQVRPEAKASNAKELLFGKLDSGYRVATAGTKNVGRSATLQLLHGSEVAIWPHAEMHAAGVLQAVADQPGTEIILESTSAGPRGLFYEYWQDAIAGRSDYLAIFIPWYLQPEYRKDPGLDFELTADELAYQEQYGLDVEQIAWRRAKVRELHGVHTFRREYPMSPNEAWAAEVPGALWTRQLLDAGRRRSWPGVQVGAIALDPSTTSKATSDEWGMIWGVRGTDKHVYIGGDDTLRTTPLEAARVVARRVKDSDLDLVIYEANQGGDMVPTILHVADRRLVCKEVRASRGKRARAEPVHALYEQGLVHHVGELELLEDEMCTWDASRSNESPNRVDALVWLVTYLLLDNDEVTCTGYESVQQRKMRGGGGFRRGSVL